MAGDVTTWEYRTVPVDDGPDLDALGRAGWELIAALAPAGVPTLYFKRPTPDLRTRVTLDQRAAVTAAGGAPATAATGGRGILHPGLGHLLASSGHTDYLTICDRGFPVPIGPARIDLALVDDLPTVLDVLGAIHAAWTIDRVLITDEMQSVSPKRVAALRDLLGDTPLETVAHLELKRLSHGARGTIRTGDTTPYANIIVVAG